MAESAAYRRHREQAAKAQKEQAREGRDIGPIPPIKDPARRKRGLKSLLAFCRIYLAASFPLPFSEDHEKVASKIQRAVERGGNFAEAMPRGSGKSTLCEAACLWAALKGLRQFIALIGAVADFGIGMVDSINSTLENNDLLLEDFPEVVFPFRALEQSNNRASGQRCLGKLTWIKRTSGKLIFPTIAGSISSGMVIVGTGIEGGRLRGLRHKLPDGRIIRPDLIIGDDLQTDESAWSLGECAKRIKAITGKILGMAGPGMTPAMIVCGTVIRRGDVMDDLLDHSKHPEWQGERMKMLYAFPSRQDLWDEYARILSEDLAAGGDGKKAGAYYRKNRREMDLGAAIAWKHRKGKKDVSAIEHAMKIFFRDRETFFAEYQNEPKEEEAAKNIMTAAEIAAKQNGLPRGEVPENCCRITAFIDVHQDALYWMATAWEEDFTGYVLDYGTYPDQNRAYFLLREIKNSLGKAANRAAGQVGMEGAIYAGLESLVNTLSEREYQRQDDTAMHVERILIDANWGQTTSLVKQFCRQSIHSALLIPSHGRYYGARHKPLSQYQKKAGERLDRDYMWHMPKAAPRQVRHVAWDTNWWKSFAHARLGVAMGDRGCVSLFAGRDHRLVADHLTAETPVHTEGQGRKLDEWDQKPNTDNHWLDCFVGCMVGAAMQGCRLEALSHGKTRPPKSGKKKMSLSELQAKRRRERGR